MPEFIESATPLNMRIGPNTNHPISNSLACWVSRDADIPEFAELDADFPGIGITHFSYSWISALILVGAWILVLALGIESMLIPFLFGNSALDLL